MWAHGKHWLLALLALSGCAASAQESKPRKRFEGPYRIALAAPKQVRATVTAAYNYPQMVAQEWLVVYAVPPQFEGQPAARARFQIVEAPAAETGRIFSETSLRQPLATLHWFPESTEGGQGFTVKASYDVTINRRTLEPGKPTSPVPALKHTERSLFLASSNHFDFTSAKFRAWLQKEALKRTPGERDLDFAHRAMTTIVRTHTYRYEPKSDRSATAVCRAGWSDCGGLSTLYVSVLRANGIPARCLSGRHLKPDGTHVRLDFYADGVGWVPADPALAIARHSANAGFGREPSDMVIMHFDVIRFERLYHWMQGIGAVRSINRNDEGTGAGMSLNHTMTVEVLAGDGGPRLAGSGRSATKKRTALRPVPAPPDH